MAQVTKPVPDPSEIRKAAIDASVASGRTLAMQIVGFPADQREAGFTIVRRNYEESLRRYGQDDAQGRAWLNLQMQYIRDLVSEIENSGGGAGGRA